MTTKQKVIFWGSVIVAGGGTLWALTHPMQAVLGGLVAASGGAGYLYYKLKRKGSDTKAAARALDEELTAAAQAGQARRGTTVGPAAADRLSPRGAGPTPRSAG